MDERKISVDILPSEVKALLVKHLDIKQAHAVADVIIGHMLLSQKGLGQLFKGLIGIFPELKYKTGDYVYVKITSLPSWRIDRGLTEKLPNVKDGLMLAKIIETNVYKELPYKINYEAVRDGQTIPAKEEYDVLESNIVEKAEDFAEILDMLEDLKNITGEDAPF